MAEQPKEISKVSIVEETLGAKATAIAIAKANKWLDDTWQVIQKTILNSAEQGLFKATIRFSDVIPQDEINQQRLLKILKKQNISGTFTLVEEDIERERERHVLLQVTWGPDLL